MGRKSDNTVMASDGIEVYESQYLQYVDEYINDLPVPELLYSKAVVFNGLLKYLYTKLFKPRPGDKVLHNANTRVDMSDIQLINDIWDNIFSPLCLRYGKNRTISRFGELTGITNDTFNQWKNGKYRNRVVDSGEDGNKTSITHSESYKRWLKECESDLACVAAENNGIGSIFLLKSCYGYQESNKLTIENTQAIPTQNLEQIAQQFSNSELPPIIDVD